MISESYRQALCRILLRDTITDPATGCMVSPKSDGGYLLILVWGRREKAHRFIAFSLLLHSDEERRANRSKVVRHLCGNKACLNPEHLCLGTQSENLIDAIEMGTYPTGEDSWSAKLSQAQVDEIRTLYPGRSQKQLANMFGVSQQQISKIVNGQKWARS